MHPALQHPRRSQIRPLDSGSLVHLLFYGIPAQVCLLGPSGAVGPHPAGLPLGLWSK